MSGVPGVSRSVQKPNGGETVPLWTAADRTFRDKCARRALPWCLLHHTPSLLKHSEAHHAHQAAIHAYLIADAMLRERK